MLAKFSNLSKCHSCEPKIVPELLIPVNDNDEILVVLWINLVKGMFYSESAGEMRNRHVKVPKIVPGLLIPVRNMKCSNKMIIFTFFCVNKINVLKARTNMY